MHSTCQSELERICNRDYKVQPAIRGPFRALWRINIHLRVSELGL